MKYTRWLGGEYDEAAARRLRLAGYPRLLSSLLSARGVSTPEEAAALLDRERELAYSPYLMKDMDKAVARIQQALAEGEKIAAPGGL